MRHLTVPRIWWVLEIQLMNVLMCQCYLAASKSLSVPLVKMPMACQKSVCLCLEPRIQLPLARSVALSLGKVTREIGLERAPDSLSGHCKPWSTTGTLGRPEHRAVRPLETFVP